jgi:hypothetical protein
LELLIETPLKGFIVDISHEYTDIQDSDETSDLLKGIDKGLRVPCVDALSLRDHEPDP